MLPGGVLGTECPISSVSAKRQVPGMTCMTPQALTGETTLG